MKTIKIKYHDPEMIRLEQKNGSDWIDMRAAEDVFLKEGEQRNISLGVSMMLPDNFEAHVEPRSSTFKNWGLLMVNSMGIIDNSYSGENDIWQFPALCTKGHDIVNGVRGTLIRKNDRICQFRIVERQPVVIFNEVEHLSGENRGGFGSTGKD